jgi:hypothetical protein
MVTIWYVLLSEILRVQLFSSPQQMVAPRTKMEPTEKLKLSVFSNERMKLDVVMNKMAIHKRVDTFSLKMNSAIIVVATISKFPSSDALLEVPYLTPNMSSIDDSRDKAGIAFNFSDIPSRIFTHFAK